jgi:hypothetical protein
VPTPVSRALGVSTQVGSGPKPPLEANVLVFDADLRDLKATKASAPHDQLARHPVQQNRPRESWGTLAEFSGDSNMAKRTRASKAAYFDALSQGFRGRVNLLQHLIADHHWASVGEHREFLLRDFLRQFLPSRYSVDTGFILFDDPDDAEESGTDSSLRPSTQIDVLIWDSVDYAPHFRAGEFVVVPPGSVMCIIEVKSTLGTRELRDSIRKFLDISCQFDELTLVDGYEDVRAPGSIVFGWDVRKNKSGSPQLPAEKIAGIIAKEVRHYYDHLDNDLPLTVLAPISGVLAYRHWAALLAVWYGRDREPRIGYRSHEMSDTVGDPNHPDLTFRDLLSLVARVTEEDPDTETWFKLHRTPELGRSRRRYAKFAVGEEVWDFIEEDELDSE